MYWKDDFIAMDYLYWVIKIIFSHLYEFTDDTHKNMQVQQLGGKGNLTFQKSPFHKSWATPNHHINLNMDFDKPVNSSHKP